MVHTYDAPLPLDSATRLAMTAKKPTHDGWTDQHILQLYFLDETIHEIRSSPSVETDRRISPNSKQLVNQNKICQQMAIQQRGEELGSG